MYYSHFLYNQLWTITPRSLMSQYLANVTSLFFFFLLVYIIFKVQSSLFSCSSVNRIKCFHFTFLQTMNILQFVSYVLHRQYVSYHVHITCLRADFHIIKWRIMWWCFSICKLETTSFFNVGTFPNMIFYKPSQVFFLPKPYQTSNTVLPHNNILSCT